MSKRTLRMLTMANENLVINRSDEIGTLLVNSGDIDEWENLNVDNTPIVMVLDEPQPEDNQTFTTLTTLQNSTELEDFNLTDCLSDFNEIDSLADNDICIMPSDSLSNEMHFLNNNSSADNNSVNLALNNSTNKQVLLPIEQNERVVSLVPYECSSDEDETYEATNTSDVQESSHTGINNNIERNLVNTNSDVEVIMKSKRKLGQNKNEWKRYKNKKLRMKGEVYMGFSKKSGKIKQSMPRKAKSLKEACTSKKCRNSKLRYCKEFTEQCRSHIFKKFWGMTWDQRKVFVASHVFKTPTFKSNKENSRRQGTYTYYLHDGNENLQVCRTMFTNTLDIGYKTIHYWVDGSCSIGFLRYD
ncbi:uncharacterized protein LOC126879520 [Diabrotica virgifera virgifera]|uniref:Uncharacterized protein n=1 Tax=Diabrotica virgifera virgifera TaxID=50390 RepID=A0ABM5JKU2_DIAVI|nr:uncharacterized protein LOC126879520 [Diabrotica virgifera virgifera]